MKKIVGILLCIAISMLCISAFAVEYPWNQPEMKVQVLDGFDYDDAIIDTNTSNLFSIFWPEKSAIKDKKLVFEPNTGEEANQHWVIWSTEALLESRDDTVNAEGYGMYIENNTAADFSFTLFVVDWDHEANTTLQYKPIGTTAFSLYDAEGKSVRRDKVGLSCLIPANFKGYLCVDLASVPDAEDEVTNWETGKCHFNSLGMIFHEGIFMGGSESVVFDDFFIYGKNVTPSGNVSFDQVTITEKPTAVPTPTATENPTDAPSQSATDAPTAATSEVATDAPTTGTSGTPTEATTQAPQTKTSPLIFIGIGAVVVIAVVVIIIIASKKKKD